MNLAQNSNFRGHIAMLFANLGWGIMNPVSKSVMLSETISPIALSGLRISGAAIFFLIFSFFMPKSVEAHQRVERKDWLKLFLCSALIISGNQALFILGIGFTSPIDSSVMGSMTPVFTMVLAAIFLGFPMTKMKITGVFVGLAGVIMLVAQSDASDTATNPWLGNSLCLAAQMCAAIYFTAFTGIIEKYSPYTLMKWLFFISAVTYVPFCLPEIMKIDFAHLGLDIWLELAYIIVFATFIGYLMIPISQQTLRPTVICAYNYLQPIFAAVASCLIGVGSFGWEKIMAALIIFLSLYLVNKTQPRKTIEAL